MNHQTLALRGIVGDQDVKFTSSFWRTLWRLSTCDLRMSTTFHPQTDGQTKMVNRNLGGMMYRLVKTASYWELVSSQARFDYYSVNQLTSLSPFQICTCYDAPTTLDLALQPPANASAMEFAQHSCRGS